MGASAGGGKGLQGGATRGLTFTVRNKEKGLFFFLDQSKHKKTEGEEEEQKTNRGDGLMAS